MTELAQKVVRICRELALCSEDRRGTTRTFLSPPMRDVHRILSDWMSSLNMRVWVDAAGNLRGLHGDPNAPRLMIGSHLDTVPNAGAFDGILGVVTGIALVESSFALPVEVVGFSEEEGVRFGLPFIGSRALVGTLGSQSAELNRRDSDGVSLKQAICNFGLDPDDLSQFRIASQVVGYLEFHIEQGPVLDEAGLPLGIVTAIAGQSRLSVVFDGHANHAGTTPMNLRRDALAAASEWIGAVEKIATSTEGLVATVGAIGVSPNTGNVIPGSVRASLDVRHASDSVRHEAVRTLVNAAAAIATRRGIEIGHEELLDQAAVPMNIARLELLERAVKAAGYPVRRMVSGAGHDAMILAPHVPSAMLFVRSPGGISHHPDESVDANDVAAALEVGRRFIAEMESVYA